MGTSDDVDVDAARAAGRATRAAVRGDDPRLLMVFSSASHDPYAVLAGVRAVAPAVPLIGCSTTAAIGPSGPTGAGGVVVVALGGAGFSVRTTVGYGATRRQRDVGAEVAGCVVDDPDRPNRILMLISDGLVQNLEELLAGVYGVVGASIPLVGGASCADSIRTGTYQLHGDEVVTDALVGALICSDGPFGIGLRHGWRKVGEPMIVTKSDHGRVYMLDEEPAAPAYLRRLGAPPEAFVDPAAFQAFAQRRPIGVRGRSGEVVRNVGSPSVLDSGWLHSSGDVAEGALIWPMDGDDASVLAAAQDASREAVEMLGCPPLGVVAFDCETRSRFLGAGGRDAEVAAMAQGCSGAPLAGLYTWGEVARTRGINGYHHHTVVILAVG